MPESKESIPASARDHALKIFKSAVAAVDPRRSVLESLSDIDMRTYRNPNIVVVGCGKASVSMARAAEEFFGNRITAGLVVTKHGHTAGAESLERIRVAQAGHPVPDRAGMESCRHVVELLRNASENDLVVALISGGGSALWPLPAEGISLDDKIRLTELLVGCGADIHEINAVRKHVSAIKGGRAAAAAFPAQTLVLAISDVIGNELSTIASGPFAPDPSTFRDAWSTIERCGLAEKIPGSVRSHLEKGLCGDVGETPKTGDRIFGRVTARLCATNDLAISAAASAASELGYQTRIVGSAIQGDIGDVAAMWVREMHAACSAGRPVCLLGGGEPTVSLGNTPGKGGRNQELALRVGVAIADTRNCAFLSCGSDGTDGPTDAAGGIVDSGFARRCADLSLDPPQALAGHDSYPLLDATGALVSTGPTGTNVMDIHVGLVW